MTKYFNQQNRTGNLRIQKKSLETHFSFLSCHITRKNELICKGKVNPEGCNEYQFLLKYKTGKAPKVFITSPRISYHKDIHMYEDTSLCLYYPPDMPWKDSILISETFIPWMIQWIIFYELWLLTGKWLGKSVKH